MEIEMDEGPNPNRSSVGEHTYNSINLEQMIPRIPNIMQSKLSISQASQNPMAVHDSANKAAEKIDDPIYHYQQQFKQNRRATRHEEPARKPSHRSRTLPGTRTHAQ